MRTPGDSPIFQVMSKKSVNIKSKTNGRRKGRPRVGSTAILVRLPPDYLEVLDNWIAKQKLSIQRPEGIRRLMARGAKVDFK